MAGYDVLLAAREEIADGTMVFHFTKPAGFAFKPGQAIDLVLAGPESPRHTFSIVSAPYQNELAIATHMRDSAYKRALRLMPSGSPAQIEGPFGSLTLHADLARPAVLIAGGIGITPFISMLRQAAYDRRPQQILLLYSNRRPEDAAYLEELQQLPRRNERFRLVATMTQMANSSRQWKGETALIDEAFIKKAAHGLSSPCYYVVGPPKMVEGMRKTLTRMGIDDNSIRSEDFYGY